MSESVSDIDQTGDPDEDKLEPQGGEPNVDADVTDVPNATEPADPADDLSVGVPSGDADGYEDDEAGSNEPIEVPSVDDEVDPEAKVFSYEPNVDADVLNVPNATE